MLGDIEGCIDLLCTTGRLPEAAFLARTYMPSQMSSIVVKWKEDLAKVRILCSLAPYAASRRIVSFAPRSPCQVSERAAQALADPKDFPNLFNDLDVALKVEEFWMANRDQHIPAVHYPDAKVRKRHIPFV